MQATETAVVEQTATEAAPLPVVAQPEQAAQTPATQQTTGAPLNPKSEARRALHANRSAFSSQEVAATAAIEAVSQQEGETPDAQATGDAAAPAATEAPRGPDGRFVPKDGTTDPSATPTDTGRAAAATGPQPGLIRIEVPEGHALRQGGREAFFASTEQEARDIRALLNGYTPRRERTEADTLRQKNEQLQQRLLELEATQQATAEFQATPEYRAAVEKYEELAADDEKEAQRYWRGVQAELQAAAEQKITQKRQEQAEQAIAEQDTAWQEEAYARTQRPVAEGGVPDFIRRMPEFNDWYVEELAAFDRRISLRVEQRGASYQPTLPELQDEFAAQLAAQLLRKDQVRSAIARARAQGDTTQQAREEGRREGQTQTLAEKAEAEKQRLLDAARRRDASKGGAPPNPIADINVQTDRQSTQTQTDLSEVPIHSLRKTLKAGFRGSAQRYFGGS